MLGSISHQGKTQSLLCKLLVCSLNLQIRLWSLIGYDLHKLYS